MVDDEFHYSGLISRCGPLTTVGAVTVKAPIPPCKLAQDAGGPVAFAVNVGEVLEPPDEMAGPEGIGVPKGPAQKGGNPSPKTAPISPSRALRRTPDSSTGPPRSPSAEHSARQWELSPAPSPAPRRGARRCRRSLAASGVRTDRTRVWSSCRESSGQQVSATRRRLHPGTKGIAENATHLVAHVDSDLVEQPRGPTGNPKSTSARSTLSIVTPSVRSWAASLR